jgi:hypothetical protein
MRIPNAGPGIRIRPPRPPAWLGHRRPAGHAARLARSPKVPFFDLDDPLPAAVPVAVPTAKAKSQSGFLMGAFHAPHPQYYRH